MRWFEIVWTYQGEEYLLETHARRSAALASHRAGRAACFRLVHGGRMRVDECSDRPMLGLGAPR